MESFHWTERLFWSSLVVVAVAGIVIISAQLAQKFSDSPLATVVETTMYPVSDIPFPSITICLNNRFSAARLEEAHKKFLPSKVDAETSRIFRVLLVSLNRLEFGAMDEWPPEVFNFTSPELSKLNLTEIFDFMMIKCEEIFIGTCWWRNKYFNSCCTNDLFSQVKSEYSLCFGFNSAVTDYGKAKDDNPSVYYPLRTSNYGDWSGLRLTLSTRTDLAVKTTMNDGISVVVNHPNQWPMTTRAVPGSSSTSIVIKPTYSYTTDDVRAMRPEQRQCLNIDESKDSMTLPGLKYLQLNCMNECHRKYMIKFCGCFVEAFYSIDPHEKVRFCNFGDLRCLFKYNDVFNYHKPDRNNPFFDDSEEGLECSCYPECSRVDYAIEVAANLIDQGDNISIDFHYQSANIVKYRTDMTFGAIDLMVSFGGIAGLFLGCSLISGVEIVFYLTLIVLSLARRVKSGLARILTTTRRTERNSSPLQHQHNIKFIKIQSLADFDRDIKAERHRRGHNNITTRY